MSEENELITVALREMSEKAVVPHLSPEAVWKAGRRRRVRALAVPALAACAAIAAVLLPLSLVSGGGHASPALSGGGGVNSAGPLSTKTPVQLRQVTGISDHRCRSRADGLPGIGQAACFRLTGPALTVTRFQSARIVQVTPDQYALDMRLTPGDARQFLALTVRIVSQSSTSRHLAIIVEGHVLADPAVVAPVGNGRVLLTGLTRAKAENLRQLMLLGLPHSGAAVQG